MTKAGTSGEPICIPNMLIKRDQRERDTTKTQEDSGDSSRLYLVGRISHNHVAQHELGTYLAPYT